MPKQKLSPAAKKRKAARDLRRANRADRKAKRAENQRKRRAARKAGKKITGKDYDHYSKSFVSVKTNRGNRGRGTKKEKASA